jgi:zinc transport system substrate-binding protein
MVDIIYNGLAKIDPEHQQIYVSNYKVYASKLNNLHENITSILQPYENRSFMVYHPAWGYFGDTYKLKMIAIEDEGNQPGPSGVAAIINQAKNENIKVIFVSPQYDISSANTIAKEIDGSVIFANPLMKDYESTINKLSLDMVEGFEND